MIGLDGARRRAMPRRAAPRNAATRRTDDDDVNVNVVVDDERRIRLPRRLCDPFRKREKRASAMIARDPGPLLILIESESNSRVNRSQLTVTPMCCWCNQRRGAQMVDSGRVERGEECERARVMKRVFRRH